ncbi:hypothetical protein DL767_002960 [Monosporascus sp. MG133]|nr:hypothetical protein DL767_002960 [Monosporascus sp. MG133]
MAVKHHAIGPADDHQHTHTVIFLHGRDSVAEEFAAEFFESEASEGESGNRTLLNLFPTIRWVFPTAPMLRSERFDTIMSQWFDMWAVESPEDKPEIQQEGLRRSVKTILGIVLSEETFVPRSKIFLGGISQGFATALATFFAGGQGFAGLIGLCSWMPRIDCVDEQASQMDRAATFKAIQTLFSGDGLGPVSLTQMDASPILIGHASDDEVVPVQNGLRMKNSLVHLGLTVEWHQYEDGGHWVNEPQGVDDICQFLRKHM